MIDDITLSSDDEPSVLNTTPYPRFSVKKAFISQSSSSLRKLNIQQPYSNKNAIDVLNKYGNTSGPNLLPTIVCVQSLAPSEYGKSPNSTCSDLPCKIIKKKPAKRKSVFQKQAFKGTYSSVQSIEESIEACVRRYSCEETPVIDIESSSSQGETTPDCLSDNDCPSSLNLIIEDDTVETEVPMGLTSNERDPIGSTYGDDDMTGNLDSSIHIEKSSPVSESSSKEAMEDSTAGAEENPFNISTNTLLFREFLCACARLEDDVNDRQRASEKLRSYHEKASDDYVESQHFESFLKQHLKLVSKDNLYACLRDVLDQLKVNRPIRRVPLQAAPTTSKASALGFSKGNNDDINLNEISSAEPMLQIKSLCAKDDIKVKKLQAALEILNKKVKKLEEAEVDLDDESDSTFLKMQRYRARCVKIYSELCKYTDTPKHAYRASKKKIRFNGTKFKEANVLIEKWLNKTGTFPDLTDVMEIIKSVNLGLSSTHIQTIAADAFQAIGEHLQKRRQRELWDIAQFSQEDLSNSDPADLNPELAAELERNKKIFRKQEQEVIEKYVEKQMALVNESQETANDGMELDESDGDEENEDSDEGDPLEIAMAITSDLECNQSKSSENCSPSQPARHDFEENHEEAMLPDNEECPRLLPAEISEARAEDVNDQNKLEQRSPMACKPFGSAGQVIQLDYFTIENTVSKNIILKLNPRRPSKDNVLRDRGNFLNGIATPKKIEGKIRRPSSGLPSDLKETIADIRRPLGSIFDTFVPPLSNLSHTTSCIFKTHGTVANGEKSAPGYSKSNGNNSNSDRNNGSGKKMDDNSKPSGGGSGSDDEENDENRRRNTSNNSDHEDSSENEATDKAEEDDVEDEDDIGEDNLQSNEDRSEVNHESSKTEADVNSSGELDENSIGGEKTSSTTSNQHIDEHFERNSDDGIEGSGNGDIAGSKDDHGASSQTANVTANKNDDNELEESKVSPGAINKTWKPQWIDNESESDQDEGTAPAETTAFAGDPSAAETMKTPEESDGNISMSTVKRGLSSEKSDAETERKMPKSSGSSRQGNKLINADISGFGKETKLKNGDQLTGESVEDDVEIEVISETIVRKVNTVTPEERVNRFLANASKLAITVTRKRPMSRETKDALTHLKKLKNINISSARGSKEPSDVMLVGEQSTNGSGSNSRSPSMSGLTTPSPLAEKHTSSRARGSFNTPSSGQRAHNLPFISSVQSCLPSSPMITGVRGGRPMRAPAQRGRAGTAAPSLIARTRGSSYRLPGPVRNTLSPPVIMSRAQRGGAMRTPMAFPRRGVPMRASAPTRGMGGGGRAGRRGALRGSNNRGLMRGRGAVAPQASPRPQPTSVPFVVLD